jgi:hypothetical protein
MAAEGEVEVFRLSPEVGKCYEHAEYTRSTGGYPSKSAARYFYMGKPKYVGRFVVTERSGWGDGGNVWSIFNDKGVKNRVDYSYWGKTCFREVECDEGPTEENKAKKAATIRNLNATPPTGIYPGGKNYHRAKANFETLGGRKSSRKTRKTRKSRRSRSIRKN